MALNKDHKEMLAVLLAATEKDRLPTVLHPDGHTAKWHTANRLREEGLGSMTETDVDRTGHALQRRGMVARTTCFGVGRWALTEHGLGQARHLARLAAAS